MSHAKKTAADPKPEFTCDLASGAEPFPHFWEHTVGSGHATLALRADWQRQLTRCRQELGFRHVRFHGLLSDDVGTLMNENDRLVYSFFNADQICDFLLSIGMRPFMELSFMPTALASGKETVFHYQANVTPPRDYGTWATLIRRLAEHWVQRYGIDEVSQWFFECWNEPNLKAFWTGSQADYLHLYQVTHEALKGVDPGLKVGGPATSGNVWVTDFLEFCRKQGLSPDFVSTHHYPTDDFGKPGDDTEAQLAASHRGVLREEAAKVRTQAGHLPLYYTEWSTSSNPFDELHDQPYAAAFITKTVMEARGLVQGYSYWTFSDVFEENYFSSLPFHGGFGLLNIHGIPKPAYRAYELLHRLGEEILPVKGQHATVDAWVARRPGRIQILVTNSALPRHPVQTELVQFELAHLPRLKTAFVERIDDTHANARARWAEMGSPESLSPATVSALELASQLIPRPFQVQVEKGERARFELSIPPQGVALITLEVA